MEPLASGLRPHYAFDYLNVFPPVESDVDTTTAAISTTLDELLLGFSDGTMDSVRFDKGSGDLGGGKSVVATLYGHKDAVNQIQYSADGKMFFSCSDDGKCILWDAIMRKPRFIMPGHKDRVLCCAVGVGGYSGVTGSSDTDLAVWDLKRGKLVQKLKDCPDAVISCGYNCSGRKIFSGCGDGLLRLWDVKNFVVSHTLQAHRSSAVVNAHPTAPYLYATSSISDSVAKVWDMRNGQSVAEFQHSVACVKSSSFAEKGDAVITVSGDGTVSVWDARISKVVGSVPASEYAMESTAQLLRQLSTTAREEGEDMGQDVFDEVGDVDDDESFPQLKPPDDHTLAYDEEDDVSTVPDEPSTLRDWAVCGTTGLFHRHLLGRNQDGSVEVWKWNVEMVEDLPSTSSSGSEDESSDGSEGDEGIAPIPSILVSQGSRDGSVAGRGRRESKKLSIASVSVMSSMRGAMTSYSRGPQSRAGKSSYMRGATSSFAAKSRGDGESEYRVEEATPETPDEKLQRLRERRRHLEQEISIMSTRANGRRLGNVRSQQ